MRERRSVQWYIGLILSILAMIGGALLFVFGLALAVQPPPWQESTALLLFLFGFLGLGAAISFAIGKVLDWKRGDRGGRRFKMSANDIKKQEHKRRGSFWNTPSGTLSYPGRVLIVLSLCTVTAVLGYIVRLLSK